MTNQLATIINEMQADFIAPTQKDVKGDPVMYKLIMTSANLHESIADLCVQKGLTTLGNRHQDLSMRMKTDAQKFLH